MYRKNKTERIEGNCPQLIRGKNQKENSVRSLKTQSVSWLQWMKMIACSSVLIPQVSFQRMGSMTSALSLSQYEA